MDHKITAERAAAAPGAGGRHAVVACLGGALSLDGYVRLIEASGLKVEDSFDFKSAARDFLRSIDRKLLLVRLAQNLKKLDLGGIDIVAARNVVKTGMEMVESSP